MRNPFLYRWLLSGMAVVGGCLLTTSTIAAEVGSAEAKEAAVPLRPAVLVHIGKFAITNSMLVTWIVAVGIIIFAQIATRNIKPVPSGAQNFWEWLVESLHNFLENIIGRELVQKTFWFFATIFIFILFVNWFGLIPGVGTIGWGHYDPATYAFHVDRPLLRGGNADLNMTTAMAAIFFLLWVIWAIQAQGVGGFLRHLFAPKGETTGILKLLMAVIFFMVGWLEVISILFRPISLRAPRVRVRGHPRRARSRHRGQARRTGRGARRRRHLEGSHRQRQRDGVEPHEPGPQHRLGHHRRRALRSVAPDHRLRQRRDPRAQEHHEHHGRSAQRLRLRGQPRRSRGRHRRQARRTSPGARCRRRLEGPH